jgi:large subunit ribosomal protein L4
MTGKDIFKQETNESVVHQALVWYLASKRRGTHNTKTKGEVSGGGRKPWRQKGTGRARAGTNRSPLWRKGGVVFGPKPRSYGYRFPKKARKLALRVALSDLSNEGKVKMVDELKVAEPKTKLAAKVLKDLGVAGKILIVLGKENEVFSKAARNVNQVTICNYKELNIFDLLKADWLVIEKTAVAHLKEALG